MIMKKIQYQYNYCIPDAVWIVREFLEQHAMDEINQYKPEYLWEMITLIALGVRKDDGESQQSAKFLERIVPKYREYIHFFVKYGVLESDNHYVVGEKCKAYWFAPAYHGRFKFIPIKSAWLIRRIEKARTTIQQTKLHPEQLKHLRRLQITDDALKVIDAMPSIHQQNCAMAQFAKIRSGIWRMMRDKTSGRLHSIATTMPAAMRPFFHIDGVFMSIVDIKNSQPYFTIMLLINPKLAAQFARSRDLQSLLESLDAVDTMDAKMFIYLVRTGRMYEYLMDNGFHGIRDTVKRKMFVVMYGSPAYHKYIPESVIFECMFPSVFERLQVIKGKITSRSADKFKSYKRLAILLQTIESHVVLDCISKRIGRECPDAAIITIHDSVMTRYMITETERVTAIMDDELTKFVGYAPTLHIDHPKTIDGAITEMLTKANARRKGRKLKEGIKE